jgi:hypothetical protein
MKSDKSDLSLRWDVHDVSDVPIQVPRGPYRRFARRIDRELEKLVARWIHAAAPNASQTPHLRLRAARGK